MRRLTASIALAGLAALAPLRPASAADPHGPAPEAGARGGFRATCEDLARFCFAESCGRDQIEAAELCRDRCPGAVVMDVMPAFCPVPDVPPPGIVLRRRG